METKPVTFDVIYELGIEFNRQHWKPPSVFKIHPDDLFDLMEDPRAMAYLELSVADPKKRPTVMGIDVIESDEVEKGKPYFE